MKVLIIEDEPKVAAFLKQGLEEHHFEVDLAYDGFTGNKLVFTGNYDIVLLDIVIPYMNGIELCKKIKQEKPDLPVIMLTALGTLDDKLSGFDAGADDYLVKPFEFKELLARISALTKRTSGVVESANKIKIADLELDLNKKLAVRSGKVIELTAKEFTLLEFLMRNKGRVVTRPEIAESVWEITFDTGTNIVDVYINILRKKIDKEFGLKLIQTRIGMGYILTDS
jgi:DNA-binding response OmpR family regulator